MRTWKGDPSKPLVSICCTTYNHEKYIEDALEGFLIQETDFYFEILVHDDASTDNTADIIREYESMYPNLIKPIYQKDNQFSKGKNPFLDFNLPQAKGKFIALCEGDDYWQNGNKLQLQVDLLDQNPEYGLVHSGVDIFHEEYNKKSVFKRKSTIDELSGSVLKKLIFINFITTCSVCIRTQIISQYIREFKQNERANWKIGDYPLWLYTAYYHEMGFINQSLATYRVLKKSASHFIDYEKEMTYIDTIFDIKNSFYNKFPELKPMKDIGTVNIYKRYLKCNFIFSKTHGVKYFYWLRKNNCSDFKDYYFFFGLKNKSINFLFKIFYNLITALKRQLI